MATSFGSGAWYLLLGGLGALAAIYLKEAVQTALRRQILWGQMAAYVHHWKGLLVRFPDAENFYTTIKQSEQLLAKAMIQGKDAAEAQVVENNKSRDAIRDRYLKNFEKNFKAKDSTVSTPYVSALMVNGADSMANTRKYLMEGKTFLSNDDAGVLGPRAAMTVVKFRSAAMRLTIGFEGLFKLIPQIPESTPKEDVLKTLRQVGHAMALDAEEYFIALVRLESMVENTKKTLLTHTVDVLRGR